MELILEHPELDVTARERGLEALDPTVRQRRRTRMHVLGSSLAGLLASGTGHGAYDGGYHYWNPWLKTA